MVATAVVNPTPGNNEVNGLIAAMAQGKSDCLGTLFDLYGGSALGLASRICCSRGMAEDVVQESFLQIWRNSSMFDPSRGSAQAFLMGIVHHKAVDAVRREAANLARERRFTNGDHVEPSGDAVAEFVWLSLRRQVVAQALAKLSPVQREALQLAYMQGLTYSEIASRLEVPLGTVKTRIRDGMIKLRTLMIQPLD